MHIKQTSAQLFARRRVFVLCKLRLLIISNFIIVIKKNTMAHPTFKVSWFDNFQLLINIPLLTFQINNDDYLVKKEGFFSYYSMIRI